MSVINDTLRELEMRGGRDGMPKPVSVPAQAKSDRKPSPLWLVPPLLGLALWGWWPTLSALWQSVETGLDNPVAVVEEAAQQQIQSLVEVVTAEPTAPAEASDDESGPQAAALVQRHTQPEATEGMAAPVTLAVAAVDKPVVEVATSNVKPSAEVGLVKAEITALPIAASRESTQAEPSQFETTQLESTQFEPIQAEPPRVQVQAKPEIRPDTKPAAESPKPVVAEPQFAIQASPLSPREQAQQLWQQAMDSEQPEALLRQALALTPDLHQARLTLLQHLGEQGEVELMAAAKAYPQEVGYPVLGAELAQAQGDTALAQRWLELAAPLGATTPWLIRRAALAQQLQRDDLAEQDYRRLLQRQPDRGAWWFGLGYALDRAGRYSEARNAYQSAQASRDLSTEANVFIEQRLGALGNG